MAKLQRSLARFGHNRPSSKIKAKDLKESGYVNKFKEYHGE